MLAPTKGSIDEFLNGRNQFSIPVYQRAYSWEKKQCMRLWKDILEMYKSDGKKHFLGTIVNVAENFAPTGIHKYTIIDGQQRITTLVILLIALRDFIENNELLESHIKPEAITDMYLKNLHADSDEQYKLILSQRDKQNLIELIEGHKDRIDEESRIIHNYNYFYNKISNGDMSADEVFRSIGKLEIVNITLERERDNPQQIFESLNSTGIDLGQSDLIRNYVLMGLEPRTQNNVYSTYWHPMENMFKYENQSALMDNFFRDYITSIEGKIPTKSKVYEDFKKIHSDLLEDNVLEVGRMLYESAKLYTNMHYSIDEDNDINLLFTNIKVLRMNVAYPFLLRVYEDYKNKVIHKEEFLEILKLSESYVFRRAICEIPTNSLNKTFATLYSEIDKENYLGSFKYRLLNLDSYKVFPNDETFYDNFILKDMYNTRNRVYLLTKLENHDNKSPIQIENFTIEHIMPQNKEMNKSWKIDIGEDYKEVQKKYLHTIGNLTLTAYNPEMGDRSFLDKLNIEGGFKESALRLNRYVVKQNTWNEGKIKERADKLYELALKIWEYPNLSQDKLLDFQNIIETEKETNYSIDNYRFSTFSKNLYDKLNRNIIDTCPDTTIEYTKRYVAFKYETNFCDIVPQSKQLKIYLNMKFENLDDPKEVARDVTSIGTWGNGDVEITLRSESNIPYILDLIYQAYEKQLIVDQSFIN